MSTKLDSCGVSTLICLHNLQPATTIHFPNVVCISKLGMALCRQFNDVFPDCPTKIGLGAYEREVVTLSWCQRRADILLGIVLRDRIDPKKWHLALIPEILSADENPYRRFSTLPRVFSKIGDSFNV